VFRLEDLTGGVGVVAFPGVFDKAGDLIQQDAVVMVKGRIDLRGRELQLAAMDVAEPDLGPEPVAGSEADPSIGSRPSGRAGGGATSGGGAEAAQDPLLVDIPVASCTGGLIARLKSTFGAHPGPLPVILRLLADGEARRLRLGEEFRVDGSAALLSELRRLLGPASVRLVASEHATV
jgi:DNA polymerase-3 subunit alpha